MTHPRHRRFPSVSALAAVLAAVLAVLWLPAPSARGADSGADSAAALAATPFSATVLSSDPGGEANVIWVGVSDGRGRPVDASTGGGLSAGDFQVSEGGLELVVLEATPFATTGASWRQVLYFDSLLTDRPTLRGAADALAAQAAALTALGTVEVVIADPEPSLLLPPTRDAALVAQVMARLALEAAGRDEIGQLRRGLLVETARPRELIAEARATESTLRRAQVDRMITWLAENSDTDQHGSAPHGPRALWLTSGATALPLDAFYEALAPGLAPSSADGGLEPPAESLARFLAVAGWAAFPVTLAQAEASDAPATEFDRWRQQAGAVERSDAVDLLGLLRRRKRERDADGAATPDAARDDAERADRAALQALALTPSADTLDHFARQTGGRPVRSAADVETVATSLARRVRLRVASPGGTTEAAETPVESIEATASESMDTPTPSPLPEPARAGLVRAVEARLRRPGDERGVHGPAWMADGPPDELGAARARRLLDQGLGGGQLDLLAQITVPAAGSEAVSSATGLATLRTQLDLTTLSAATRAALSGATLRLTLSAEGDGSKISRTALVLAPDLSTGTSWEHSVELELPRDLERAAVILEALAAGGPAGGLYGGELASLGVGSSAAIAEAAGAADVDPSVTTTTLLEPGTDTIRRSEDGRFLDRVDVRLAELYVTVTGQGGAPIRGLTRDQFVLRQGGVVQPIDSVTDAIDLPVTLGLAIDSSSSMFYKLPAVSKAAKNLVRSLTPGRDRTFLVAFGPEPRLLQATTGDLDRVDRSLRGLEADGGTPLWAAILLSLEQLAEQPGKRALVVFLDGADDDGNEQYRDCLNLAQRAGVPIYLIVMNNEAARTEGKDFRTRSFTSRLDRLAAAGSGRVYYLPIDADLEPVYRRIENELRSYYLVTFYSSREVNDPTADIEVEVARDGISVRKLSGYGPGE